MTDAISILIFLAIFVGIVALAIFVPRALMRRRYPRFAGAQVIFVIAAIVFAVAAAAAGFIIGGNLGGAYAAQLAEHFGLASDGPLIAAGIGTGMALVFGVPQALALLIVSYALLAPKPVQG